MEETTTPAVQEAAPETQPASVPPWEREGVEFNPETAWTLIQNLRADNAALRAEKAKEQEPAPEPAPTPEPEPEPDPEPAPNYEAELTAARVENAKLRALAGAGLSLDLAAVVAGSTADEVEANVALLRESIGVAPVSREVHPHPPQAPVSEPAPAVSWLDIVRGNNY